MNTNNDIGPVVPWWKLPRTVVKKPFDLKVSRADILAALAWWRNLSLNQMKELERKYEEFPNPGSRTIHQMWESEGKPQPQALIPV